MGSDEQALPATDCKHLLKPKALVSCNRDILCPSDWTVGNWSEVSSEAEGTVVLSLLHQPLTHFFTLTWHKIAYCIVSITSDLLTAFPVSSLTRA